MKTTPLLLSLLPALITSSPCNAQNLRTSPELRPYVPAPSVPESAAPSQPSDTDERVLQRLTEIALQSNPNIQSARLELQSREYERESAWQQFMPTPSIIYEKSDQPSRLQLNQETTTVRLQQPLWTGGRLTANLDQADSVAMSSHFSTQLQIQTVLEQLIQTLSRYRQARLRVLSLTESIRAHERLLDQVRRRINEGLSPPSDLTVAESRLLNISSEKTSAQSELQQQQLLLTRLLGQPLTGKDLALLTTLVQPDRQALSPSVLTAEQIQSLAALQPRLQKLAADRLQLDHRTRALKANRSPQVFLRMDRTDGNVSGRDHTAVVTVSTNWGAGLANEKDILAARSRGAAIESDIQAEEQDTVRRIGILQDDLNSQLQRHQQLSEALVRIKAFQQSTERLYLTGRKAWLDVLNAAREVSATEIATSDALLQAWNNTLQLRLLQQGPSGLLNRPSLLLQSQQQKQPAPQPASAVNTPTTPLN